MLTRFRTLSHLFFLCLLTVGSRTRFGQEANQPGFQKRWTGEGYAICASCTAPKEMTWRADLAGKDEPGDRIAISGTVYQKDGLKPAANVVLFVYQTDAAGYYHRPEEDVFNPRLHGWMRTGRNGRYEFTTVRPAPEVYHANEPAHIHVTLYADGIPEKGLPEYWFEGDKRIKPSDAKKLLKLGSFSPIIRLTRDKDEVWRGVRNIRIDDGGGARDDE